MATVLLLTMQCCLKSTNGAARSVRAMLEVLARRGDACHSLGASVQGVLDADHSALVWRKVAAAPSRVLKAEVAGVQHWRVPVTRASDKPLSPADAQALMRWGHVLVKRLKPDLVLCHGEPWLAPLLAVARQGGARVLAYLADPARLQEGLPDLSAYDGWLSPSHAMAQQCNKRFEVLPQVCRSLVTAPLDGSMNLQAGRLATRAGRMVTMINPEPGKGGLLFLSLAAQMLHQAPTLKFLAVEGRWGKSQWAAAGVNIDALTNLSWQPSTPDMSPVYARSALLLVPSLWFEVSGRVVAEALLAGVPVLATRSGGIAEQLNDGGFLFDVPASMQGDFLATPSPAELQPWVHYIRNLMLGSGALYARAVALALQASAVFRPEATEPALCAVVDRVLAAPVRSKPDAAQTGSGAGSGLQIKRTQAVPGCLFGLAQPSLLVRLHFAPCAGTEALAGRWLNALAPHLPTVAGLALVPVALPGPVPQLLEALAGVVHRLQAAAGLTVVPEARFLDERSGHCTLALPGPAPAAVGQALAWALQALDALAADPLATALPDAVLRTLALLQKRLASLAPGGTNKRHFLRVAYAMGIPVLALPGGVFQFGWGRRSRLFNSTITDGTGAIATAWAKNKHQTNALLRMAGMPVPEQVVVATLEAAIAAAQRIGYPVVLKPPNLEQGIGVEAGLRHEAELRVAHARSSRYARTLLLEKHVAGDDYRVNVVLGAALSASHRTPARVVGDGLRCVADLVAATNRERQPAGGAATVYKPIEIDAEAMELLAREGLQEQSVLPEGHVLTLRRTANSSRGGSSVDVTHLMHPDNAALCVQAAALLRLDIAGLDLLMPDISRSWREVGAAFCEVNAQPQTGGSQPWMFEAILKRFVVGRGRVPAVLVLGGAGESRAANEMVNALAQAGRRTGLVKGTAQTLLGSCRAQLMAPDLGAIVVVADGAGLLRWGLPLDRFDVLVMDGWNRPAAETRQTLGLLEPHVALALVDETAPELAALQQLWGDGRVRALAPDDALPQALMQTLEGLDPAG